MTRKRFIGLVVILFLFCTPKVAFSQTTLSEENALVLCRQYVDQLETLKYSQESPNENKLQVFNSDNDDLIDFVRYRIMTIQQRRKEFNLSPQLLNRDVNINSVIVENDMATVDLTVDEKYLYSGESEPSFQSIDFSFSISMHNGELKIVDIDCNDEYGMMKK